MQGGLAQGIGWALKDSEVQMRTGGTCNSYLRGPRNGSAIERRP